MEVEALSDAELRSRLDLVMAEREGLWRSGAPADAFEAANAARDVLVAELYRRGCEQGGEMGGLRMVMHS